ncbi:CoA-binding protein [Herminiimonas sp. CN]|uniref:CoA-binding protein n=1 Tax=Herminiimonas sp. CN TaxID=1349818 RepID=UPI00047345F2|nr:CoA-binding protein [Herminiimonas sp. CN]
MHASKKPATEVDFQRLFAQNRTIAVVGLSAKTYRPSHEVARAMQAYGYRIIPVNPMLAGTYLLDEYCYATLTEAAAALQAEGIGIDIVDCFRKSADIAPIADQAIAIGARVLWLQIGIVDEAAAVKARAAGLQVVMDRCIKVDAAIYPHRSSK